MENKQKKKLFRLIYLTLYLFVTLGLAYCSHLSAVQIVDKVPYDWLHYTIISLCALLYVSILMDMLKTCRKKNKYGLSKFVYFLILLTVVGIISLMIVSSKLNLVVSQNTKYAIFILVISEAFIIYAFVLGLKLTLLSKNKAITIDSNSKTPDFDDELMLKKKLDELNRKLEIKKVQDKIDEVQKELDGEN